MASSTGPNLGLQYGWALGEDGWNTGMDLNLKRLDATVHLSVKDKDLSTPPGSPTSGDRYIVGAAPTGAWAGQAGNVAVYINAGWTFYVPKKGWLAYVEDEASIYYFTTAWVKFGVSGGGNRSLWVPASAFKGAQALAAYNQGLWDGYAYLPFSGSADEGAHACVAVPYDWGAFVGWSLVFANGGSSTNPTRWRGALESFWDGDAANVSAGYQDNTITPAAALHQIKEAPLASVGTMTWLPGEGARIHLLRMASTDSGDTNTSEMRVLGLKITYTWAP